MAEEKGKTELTINRRKRKMTAEEQNMSKTNKLVENDICRGCNKEVKQSGILCETCKTWYHYKCEKIKKVNTDSKQPYACKMCNEIQVMKEIIKNREEEIEEMNEELRSKDEIIERLSDEKVKISNKLKETEQQL